jgi:hypothetical protein
MTRTTTAAAAADTANNDDTHPRYKCESVGSFFMYAGTRVAQRRTHPRFKRESVGLFFFYHTGPTLATIVSRWAVYSFVGINVLVSIYKLKLVYI